MNLRRSRSNSHIMVAAILASFQGPADLAPLDFSIGPLEPKTKGTKCRLPDCSKITIHRGGYCSATHCKWHRQAWKGLI